MNESVSQTPLYFYMKWNHEIFISNLILIDDAVAMHGCV